MDRNVLSVNQLVSYIKGYVDNNASLKNILVKGEISNFTNHRSGHYYFTLKDNNARISCVMFSSNVSRCLVQLKEGMQVIISASVSMYVGSGSIQLYVTSIQPDGLGSLYLMYEQLKEKLLKEGLFSEYKKKVIPEYPFNIAIVSAPSGAALQDCINIISRRWPVAKINIYPCLVQGKDASKDIINKLLIADKENNDVILLIRGGGSLEDLWCFNDEQLARTISDLSTCIISGVGHETDTTLVDFVSDLRAPTPSGAAELATPNILEVEKHISNNKQKIVLSMNTIIQNYIRDIEIVKAKPFINDPLYFTRNYNLKIMNSEKTLNNYSSKLKEYEYKLKNIYNYLNNRVNNDLMSNKTKMGSYSESLRYKNKLIINKNKDEIRNKLLLLDAYNPLEILKRGYSIASNKENIVKSINDVGISDIIDIKVSDGIITTKVVSKE